MWGRAARIGVDVEVEDGQGVKGGVPAGDEAGYGQPKPPRQAGHQGRAVIEPLASPGRLERHQRPGLERGAAGGTRPAAVDIVSGRGDQLLDGHTEPAHVVLRQVHPPDDGVFGHVLPVFDELEPCAYAVGPLQPSGGGVTEDGEHRPPDRVGRQPAVADEILEALVPVNVLVLPVGLDQVEKRGRGQGQAAHRLGHPSYEGVDIGS